MKCYLCSSSNNNRRKGEVRDSPGLGIMECQNCGLVYLSSSDHINREFYENSGMHGVEPTPISDWLKDTECDDQRRFDMIMTILPNKSFLDFGCGAGGLLAKAKNLGRKVSGIELESRVQDYWTGQIEIFNSIDSARGGYDLITAFHVLEHLPDPRTTLTELAKLLTRGGRIIVEVPSADDALLTLYDCEAFQRFTYWSQHLYLFSAATLKTLAIQSGLSVIALQYYQRYPLSNHLQWLAKQKPGGHQCWPFLDNTQLLSAYANTLATIGKSDTLIAHIETID